MNNILLCNELFENYDYVRIPRVYSKLTSRNVIVMEYLPGIKIDDIEELDRQNIDTKKLANQLIKLFVTMIIEYGYLHSDPHPGNLAVTNNGEIILYDFGIFEQYDENFKNVLKELFMGFVEKDIEKVMNIMLKYEIVYALDSQSRTVEDMNDLEYVIMYKILTYVFDYTRTLKLDELIFKLESDKYIDMHSIPFLINSKMILMFKTMTTLEGVCKILDNSFTYDELFLSLLNDVVGSQMIFTRAMSDLSSLIENGGAVTSVVEKNKIRSDKLKNAKIELFQKEILKNNIILIWASVISIITNFIL